MSNTPNGPPGATPARAVPNLEVFEGPRFGQYRLVRDRLGREPIAVIADMRLKGRPRTRAGEPILADDGRQMMAFPSFRDIAPVISHRSGENVSHEAVRRWWYLAWGPEGHPLERDLGRRRYFGRKRGRVTDAPPAAVFLPPSEVTPTAAEPGWDA